MHLRSVGSSEVEFENTQFLEPAQPIQRGAGCFQMELDCEVDSRIGGG
jgi:hypothetical protein